MSDIQQVINPDTYVESSFLNNCAVFEFKGPVDAASVFFSGGVIPEQGTELSIVLTSKVIEETGTVSLQFLFKPKT